MFSMGRTCLHVAAQAGALAALTCLVNIHRLDVMTVTVSQMTALHCAAKEGHIATVRWLLEQGVPVNDRCVFCLTEVQEHCFNLITLLGTVLVELLSSWLCPVNTLSVPGCWLAGAPGTLLIIWAMS